MQRTIRRTLMTLAATVGLVAGTLTPANAATSLVSMTMSGKTIATVWYNAGTHNMSKGRNSFTLRAEKGIYNARVFWEFWSTSDIEDYENVWPTSTSAAERSFSAWNRAQSPAMPIYYYLCVRPKVTDSETCTRSNPKQDWAW
ncbi:hypothetical protein [Herbidospora mongoliensis]|uniref:hypothetical protein n=1 Tax=Herbidospora mongoliensis TaxID=688067 RepID=UPI000835A699|nr:hypothetical protein [Herbidospora mongoliensis]